MRPATGCTGRQSGARAKSMCRSTTCCNTSGLMLADAVGQAMPHQEAATTAAEAAKRRGNPGGRLRLRSQRGAEGEAESHIAGEGGGEGLGVQQLATLRKRP
mmetsp:Transcript_73675/g.227679  ORF Transcript_73675/g.227679 Transcript_73675/m.227679 type:complete len:102 (-) Transcript_73675:2-307(-)